ncbi:hypothetical protein GDO81_010955, partial [Engystomops pustulosus]
MSEKDSSEKVRDTAQEQEAVTAPTPTGSPEEGRAASEPVAITRKRPEAKSNSASTEEEEGQTPEKPEQ